MTNLIVPEQSAHWYYRDGKPCYEMPNKSKPGQFRSTTVKDARELELSPSVSGFTGVLNKPGLNSWIAMQYVLSSLTLPRIPGENQDDFARRVVRDARIQSENAAGFGTNIHDLAEKFLTNRYPDLVSPVDQMFMQGFMKWCHDHTVKPLFLEQNFCNREWDFGGRIDFIGFIDGVFCIADWKTQGKSKDNFVYYPEWNTQLSGYKLGVEEELPEIKNAFKVSVVISSLVAGDVGSMMWLEEDDDQWGLRSFHHCRGIYFSPLGPGGSLHRKVKHLI